MFGIGIGIGIGTNRFVRPAAAPNFSGTQWQLITPQTWDTIATNWN